jgi:poly(3-hydroxybutyrate) depolymerase
MHGPGSFAFADPRPGPARRVDVFTYRPSSFTAASPVLFVMHGRNRNGEEYRNWFAPVAERHGFLAVAPSFSEEQYAHPYEYNYGNVIRADGTWKPREEWIDVVVEALFDEVVRRSGSTQARYAIFGHSAGAQLVHRMATLAWPARLERAVSANAGSYTMPSAEDRYPFGIAGSPVGDAELRVLFSRDLLVLLGDADNDPAHYQLPTEPEAMRQGPHRFARGQRYMEVARREARRLGVALEWRMAVAPGVAHVAALMAPHAGRHLFYKWRHTPIFSP